MIRSRILGPLKEGLFRARGPDPGGSSRAGRQAARQATQHTSHAHTTFNAHPTHVHPPHAPAQSLSTSINQLFSLIAPAIAVARASVRSAPIAAPRLISRHAAQHRVPVGSLRSGAVRPTINLGAHTARQPIHQVGLGTARTFATGAGRPALQNIQNAPQFLRALADQKDRLGYDKKAYGKGRARMVKGPKAEKQGSGRKLGKTVAQTLDEVHSTYFPVAAVVADSKPEPVKSAAIVLVVPLEPTTSSSSDDGESELGSSDQGHLLNASFLGILRHREEQLLRAQRVFEVVQSSVDDGSARYDVQPQALTIRFDARKWSQMDIRALLGLWDTLGETWYRMGQENRGWVEAKVEEEEVSDESEATTIGSISIDLDSPRLSRRSSFGSSSGSPSLDYDMNAHDQVAETLQLPSVMFGASFMQTSAPTVSSPLRPSPLRQSSSTWDVSSEASLDRIDEVSEVGSDDSGSVRRFIERVDSMKGGFPSTMLGARHGEMSDWETDWSVGSGMDSGSSVSEGSWRI